METTTTTPQAISEFDQQAIDFLQSTGSTLTIKFAEYGKHFATDTEKRDIYTVTLQRGNSKYAFNYGDSINNTAKRINYKKGFTQPSNYDVLSCLTTNNPYTFNDFCDSYGYGNDSMSAKNTYDKVVEEYLQLSSIYSSEELEQLSEIQ